MDKDREIKKWKIITLAYAVAQIILSGALLYESRQSMIALPTAYAAGIESEKESICDVIGAPRVDGYCLIGQGDIVQDWSCPFGKLKVRSIEPASRWDRLESWFKVGCHLE